MFTDLSYTITIIRDTNTMQIDIDVIRLMQKNMNFLRIFKHCNKFVGKLYHLTIIAHRH